VDDFGLKPMRPPAPEDLYEVIDARYGKGAIIVMTNTHRGVGQAARRRPVGHSDPGPLLPDRRGDRDHREELQAKRPIWEGQRVMIC